MPSLEKLRVGMCGSVKSRVDPRTITFRAVAGQLSTVEPLRVPPPFHDVRPMFRRWRMYGNDRFGCCTFAGLARIMELNAARCGKPWRVEDEDVIDAYLDLNDGQDVGAQPLDALTYMRNVGINGHKILAFARVDDRDVYERQSAMTTFGSLYVAAALPMRLDEDRDLRWELTPADKRTQADEPRSLGGHAYSVHGYQHGEEFTVPWDQEVVEEVDWTNYYREETWVFVDDNEVDVALREAMLHQLSAIKES